MRETSNHMLSAKPHYRNVQKVQTKQNSPKMYLHNELLWCARLLFNAS